MKKYHPHVEAGHHGSLNTRMTKVVLKRQPTVRSARRAGKHWREHGDACHITTVTAWQTQN